MLPAHDYRVATPRDPDPSLPRETFIDLKSGYVLRALDEMDFSRGGEATQAPPTTGADKVPAAA